MNPAEPFLLPGLAILVVLTLALVAVHRRDAGHWPRGGRDPAATRRRMTWVKVTAFIAILVGAFVWTGDVVTASSGGGRTTAALPAGVGAAAGEQIFWGNGKCHTCHSVGTRGGKIRGPNLGSAAGDSATALPIGLRAATVAAERAVSLGRPMTATDYLVESIASPSAYLSHGYKDEMPKAYQPPISLTPDQVTSVIIYLQTLGGTAEPSAIHLPPEIAQAVGARAASEEVWKPYFRGDSARGHAIYFDSRGPAACAKCHRVGDRGGTSGPDLTSIGASRSPRSIVESVVDSGKHVKEEFATLLSLKDFHDLLTFLEALQPYVSGDTTRGGTLFFDVAGRAACAKCHRVGTRGGDAGPEMTAVVAIRSSEFLLEAVLKPSKYIASGYQTVRIRTSAGRTLEGVVVRETSDSVWLGTSDGDHVSMPLRTIVERRALETSLMPDTLAKLLSARDIGDLMAFLETLR